MISSTSNIDLYVSSYCQKPFFGWSGWGRARVYNKDGSSASVTDGKWIIELGATGAIGFIFSYALFFVTLLYALRNINYIEDPKSKVYFASLAIILAICVIDSIPNTGMVAMHLLLAGALLGQAESLKQQNSVLSIKSRSQYAKP